MMVGKRCSGALKFGMNVTQPLKSNLLTLKIAIKPNSSTKAPGKPFLIAFR
jgi:hypothetical protein